jgi:GNAT superfamily N-acetyltransferase
MYEIVRYDTALKGEIATLQRHLWGGDVAANTAYFEWKYEQNPYFKEPLVYLAVTDGRVVGMRGMHGSRWEVGTPSETFLIPAAADLVIAPDHRGRGLFARIMRAAVDDLAARGYSCAFCLSPGPVTLAGSLATGWRAAGFMRPLRRETPTHQAARVLYEVLRKLPLPRWSVDATRSLAASVERTPFNALDHRGRRPGTSRSLSLAQAPRVEAMADLVRRIGHDGRLRHVRDEIYLAWRFRNPLYDYRFLFWDGDCLEGYLVLQVYRFGLPRVVNIVDWEGTSSGVRAELLRAAIEWGQFPNLGVWAASLPEDTLTQLQDASFVPFGHGPLARYLPSVLVRAVPEDRRVAELTLGGRRLLDSATWDMRMVYSMAG